MTLQGMWKEKLGNYLIDVSKFIFTGVVIASMFKDVDSKTILYVLGLAMSLMALVTGLVLTNKKRKGEK